MNKFIWIILAFISGAFLPIQGALNTKLGNAIQSPAYSSMISFFIGMISVAVYILLSHQTVDIHGAKTAPAYVWVAGALGAFYVTVIILAFPRLGPALTFGLVVAGQMVISILMDHFNILVANQHPINIWRLLGVACVVGGVILIRKF